jgi:ribosomal-protein-alanine N-acetyltransferase
MAAAASDAMPVPEIRLRAMTEADVAAVIAIEHSAYAFPWSEGIFVDCLRVGYGCCVLELEYAVIGYGVVAAGAGEAHLLNLCVREEFRGRGLGRRLLEALLEQAVQAGARIAFLEVRPANIGAIRLYEHAGFHQIGIRRGYYQSEGGREDAIVMRRVLER